MFVELLPASAQLARQLTALLALFVAHPLLLLALRQHPLLWS